MSPQLQPATTRRSRAATSGLKGTAFRTAGVQGNRGWSIVHEALMLRSLHHGVVRQSNLWIQIKVIVDSFRAGVDSMSK